MARGERMAPHHPRSRELSACASGVSTRTLRSVDPRLALGPFTESVRRRRESARRGDDSGGDWSTYQERLEWRRQCDCSPRRAPALRRMGSLLRAPRSRHRGPACSNPCELVLRQAKQQRPPGRPACLRGQRGAGREQAARRVEAEAAIGPKICCAMDDEESVAPAGEARLRESRKSSAAAVSGGGLETLAQHGGAAASGPTSRRSDATACSPKEVSLPEPVGTAGFVAPPRLSGSCNSLRHVPESRCLSVQNGRNDAVLTPGLEHLG
jgi:hypothetical protein